MSELKQLPIKIAQEAYDKAEIEAKEKGTTAAKRIAVIVEEYYLSTQPKDDLPQESSVQAEQPKTEAEPEPYVYRGL